MRYSERELSLQRGKTTVFDCHEIVVIYVSWVMCAVWSYLQSQLRPPPNPLTGGEGPKNVKGPITG